MSDSEKLALVKCVVLGAQWATISKENQPPLRGSVERLLCVLLEREPTEADIDYVCGKE